MSFEGKDKPLDVSYRCHFNLKDDTQLRLYDFMNRMQKKDRHSFMIYALNLVARNIGYEMPADGPLGVMSSIAVTSNSPPAKFPDIDLLKEKYKSVQKQSVPKTAKSTKTKAVVPVFEDEDNYDDEDDSEIAKMIASSLSDI